MRASIVQALLERGADPAIRDIDGLTALEWARQPEILAQLEG